MANTATVGILRVLLTADAAEYESVLKRTASSAQQWTRSLKDVGRQATELGSSLTRTLTLPIAGVAAAAVKTGVQFESVMNSIQGVLTPTGAEMDKVRETAIKMGADTAFSATDAATAMLELGKAGFSTAESIAAVPQVLELAAASGLSMGEAAELAARTLKAFGLETSDLSHVNDVLAKAVNSSTLEISDLQTAFKYIGPIASGFGLSIEEVSAALAIMRDNGIAAETSGRALREGMSRLANPVKAVHEVLGELGVDLKEVDPSLHSMSEIVGVLQGKGLTAAQSLRLFGDAAGPGMFALVSQGREALVGLTTQFENSEGAAKKMADAMMQGLPGAMERLRGSVETAMLSISKAIEPSILAILSVGEKLADLITTKLVPAFTALPQWVQTGAIAMTGLAAAAGPVIFVIGQMITAVSTVTGLFTQKGIVMRGLGPVLQFYSTSMTAAAGATTTMATSARALIGIAGGIVTVFGSIAVAFAQYKNDWSRALDVLIPPLGLVRIGLDAIADGHRNAAAAAKEQNEEEAKLRKDLSGIDLVTEMDRLNRIALELETVGEKATPKMLRLADAAERLQQQHVRLSPALQRVVDLFGSKARAATAAAANLPKLTDNTKDLGKAVEDTGRATRDYYNFVGERRMEDERAMLDSLQRQRSAWNEQFAFLATLRQQSTLQLQSTLDLSKMFEPLKTAPGRYLPTASQWGTAWDQMKVGLTNTLSNLPQLFTQAFTGGGGLMGALKALGVQLADALVQPLLAHVRNVLAKQLGGAINSGVSGTGAIGGLGAGGLAFGIMGAIGLAAIAMENARAKARAFREALQRMRVDLLELKQSMQGAAAAFPLLNAEFERLFNGPISEASNKRMAAILAEMQGKVADINTGFGDLATRMLAAGGQLPASLQPVLSQLVQMGVLSKENVALFQQLTGVTHVGVDWKATEEAARRYGDWLMTELGPAVQQAKQNDLAQQMIDDFDRMKRSGVEVGSILFGMKEEIVALIKDSIKFGTTIPENMRPWIQELEKAGLLVDENGEHLYDLGALKFGQPVKTEVEKITDAFALFIEQLDIVTQRLANLPTPDIKVPGVPGGPGSTQPGGNNETMPVPAPFKAFAKGGLVTRRTIAMLGEAGPELVIPLGNALNRMGGSFRDLFTMPRMPDFAFAGPGMPIGRIDEEKRPSDRLFPGGPQLVVLPVSYVKSPDEMEVRDAMSRNFATDLAGDRNGMKAMSLPMIARAVAEILAEGGA